LTRFIGFHRDAIPAWLALLLGASGRIDQRFMSVIASEMNERLSSQPRNAR
jgi:hypothetical protein